VKADDDMVTPCLVAAPLIIPAENVQGSSAFSVAVWSFYSAMSVSS